MTTDPWLIISTSASVAAAISLAGSIITISVTERRERLTRQRDTFAKALAAAVDFREFPFVVRRRRASEPEGERARISEELRAIQQELNYYSAWIEVESAAVATAYRSLVDGTRRIVGPMIREAWSQPPISQDVEVNIRGLDFSALEALDGHYIETVREHLSWTRALRKLATG